MTRINLINPTYLSDQHLMAEYRELPRIFNFMRKKYLEGKILELPKPGAAYVLGTGHVTFFRNKITFLHTRWHGLVYELTDRDMNISPKDWDFAWWAASDYRQQEIYHWQPSMYEIKLNANRIIERVLDATPDFNYRYLKENISTEDYVEKLHEGVRREKEKYRTISNPQRD